MQLIVLGMHRSGTSAVTRILNLMGAYVGPEGSTTGANEENPKGFWERKDVRALCDEALAAGGGDWWRVANFDVAGIPEEHRHDLQRRFRKVVLELDGHRPWVIKEPRLCVLFDLYRPTLEAPVAVLSYRDPVEIAMSLNVRNGFPLPTGIALWERYTRDALAMSEDVPRLLVRHTDLLDDPVSVVLQLHDALTERGVTGLRVPSDSEITAYISKDLHRQRSSESRWEGLLTSPQVRLAKSMADGTALHMTGSAVTESSQFLLEVMEEGWQQDERLRHLNAEVESLRTKLAEDDRRLEDEAQMSRELRQAIADSTSMTAEVESLRTKLAEDDRRLEDEAQMSRELRQAIADSTSMTADLRKELAQAQEVVRRLRAEESKLRQGTQAASSDLSKIRKAVIDADQTLEQLSTSTSWQVTQALVKGATRVRNPRGAGGWDSIAVVRERLRAALQPVGAPPAQSTSPPSLPGASSSAGTTAEQQRPARWTQTLARMAAAGTVSIVVPVFNAFDEVADCIKALQAHTTGLDCELVLIDDASTDERILPLLERHAVTESVRLIRNHDNIGYTATINKAIRTCPGDIVLLNSDTMVTPLWLQSLALTAYSEPKVGIVTPLSDNAGAFSVPEAGKKNDLPDWLSPPDTARLVRHRSARWNPTAPTGSGFCMYIRREVIADIGLFDEEQFPRGYGEENDFCLRAEANGWRTVIDDTTIVYHVRSASFGAEKTELLKAGRAAIDATYPSYTKSVRTFGRDPDMQAVRQTVADAFAEPQSAVLPRVLYILHDGSGGTPRTNLDLMNGISDRFEPIELRSYGSALELNHLSSTGQRTTVRRVELPNRIPAHVPTTDPAYRDAVAEIIITYGIELVHIRHLIGHTEDIVTVPRQLGLPVVMSLHDYFGVCPTTHLLDEHGKFCGGRCTPGPGDCPMAKRYAGDFPKLKHEYVLEWQPKMGAVFAQIDGFVTTSDSAREIYTDIHPAMADYDFQVIEHGRDFAVHQPLPIATPTDRIKLLAAGNVGPHKGAAYLRDLLRIDKQREDRLEVHLLGRVHPDFESIGILHGQYEREEFAAKVAGIAPRFNTVLSPWAETFSHTLTEGWALGLPALVSNLGAPAERVSRHGGGWILDIDDPEAGYDAILAADRDTGQYESAVASAIRNAHRSSTKDMAEQYANLYDSLLLAKRSLVSSA